MAADAVLIAQLTDCHVVEPGGLLSGRADSASMLADAVRHVNELTPQPDLVVVTGDLVNDGRPEQYVVAAQVLGELAPRLLVLPGNHDDRKLLREHFAHLPAGGPDDRLDVVVDDLAGGDGPLVVGLDTSIPGHEGGRASSGQMAWLDGVLSAAPDRPTLVFQHHPPFDSGIDWMDPIGLADRHLLAAVVASHPQVALIDCGHLHRPITARFAGTVAMSIPSTGPQLALALDGTPFQYVDEPPIVAVHRCSTAGDVVTHLSQVGGPPPWLPPWARPA